MDLPFAAARWCGAAGVDKVATASDYRGGKFGEDYGAMIKELYLHARAVSWAVSASTVAPSTVSARR